MEQTNAVALMGIAVDELQELAGINGTKIKCSRILIETKRKSSTSDYAEVFITEKTKNELLPFNKGLPVMVIGKVQTCKDFKVKHVLTFVLADYIGTVNGEHWEEQNDVYLKGRLGKGIMYRTRNSGKRITTIMLETDSALRVATKCYIPCICWQAVADRVKNWATGDEVEIKGRLQSRIFTKHLADTTAIERTSYEVSISTIKKVTER